MKAKVSRRALLQRINRKLLAEAEGDAARADQVRTSRGDKARQELGAFYRVDVGRNSIAEKDVDLEELGRELKVLAAWERLDD